MRLQYALLPEAPVAYLALEPLLARVYLQCKGTYNSCTGLDLNRSGIGFCPIRHLEGVVAIRKYEHESWVYHKASTAS